MSVDAEWCPQCFSAPAEEGPEEEPADTAEISSGARAPEWTCPACGEPNAIERDLCAVCGTSFAKLFEEPVRRRDVPLGTALAWSIALPGLGHAMLGRGGEGLARGALYAWTLGLATLLLMGRTGSPAAPVAGMLMVFFGAAIAVNAFAAAEVVRIGRGGDPLLEPKQVMWVAVAMIISTVVLATIVVTGAIRAR